MTDQKYGNAFQATYNGIKDLFKKREKVGELDPNLSLEGKNCLVTGANSGLGFAISRQLAERGAQVWMACRSGIPEAGEKIKELTGSDKVKMLPVDFNDLQTVKDLSQKLKSRNIQLDITIPNAAIVPRESRKTKQGLEEMFQVNYLANFLLLNTLIEEGIIPKASEGSGDADFVPRIVYVSSETHRSAATIDFDRFGKYADYSMAKSVSLYGYYKFLSNTYLQELSRRVNKDGLEIAVHSLCPGPVNSNIAREAPSLFKPLVKVIFGLFFSSPEKAAEPALYLSCSPDVEGESDWYLHLMTRKEVNPQAKDLDLGKELWRRSQDLLETVLPVQA